MKCLFFFLLCIIPCFAEYLPEESFKALMAGNNRFVTNKCEHSDRCSERLAEATQKHAPMATIVTCSDARLGPELIFDQGIGDLFVVRVAGNVVGSLELESIKFASQVFKSPLIFVMGHQNCGAVQAVLSDNTKDIRNIAKLIRPAIKNVNHNVEAAVKANAIQVANQLRMDPVLIDLVKQQKLLIKQGYYSFAEGKVEVLD